MDLNIDSASRTARLILAGDLSVAKAAELLQALRQALDEADTVAVRLDEERVERIDLAFLQLMCSAHRTAVATKKRLFFEEGRAAKLTATAQAAGFLRRQSCILNPGNDCLWLVG